MDDIRKITEALDRAVEPYLVHDEDGTPLEGFGHLRRGARSPDGAMKGWPNIDSGLVAWHILHEMPPDYENTRMIMICTPPIHDDDAERHPAGFHLLTDETLGNLDYSTDELDDLVTSLRACLEMLARQQANGSPSEPASRPGF